MLRTCFLHQKYIHHVVFLQRVTMMRILTLKHFGLGAARVILSGAWCVIWLTAYGLHLALRASCDAYRLDVGECRLTFLAFLGFATWTARVGTSWNLEANENSSGCIKFLAPKSFGGPPSR